MTIISNKRFGEERALYGLCDAEVSSCTFSGDEDGESALKESSLVRVTGSEFALRYPLWHAEFAEVADSLFTETCRAGMWYTKALCIKDSRLHGTKALREADDTLIEGCDIRSEEFGWKCRGVRIKDSSLESEYAFLDASDMEIDGLEFKGKYSFQYVKNAVIRNSQLDTKDAFWHTENVTVYDSTVSGQYLGWYSKNLRLVRCRISGTQPLCYCEGLTLIDCTTEGCDLSFERSTVSATVSGDIMSIKNPAPGSEIIADSIGEMIFDDYGEPDKVKITIRTGAK